MNICHANEKSSTELTIQCCHHTTGRRQNHFIQLSLDDPSETQKEEFTFEIEQMKLLGSHKNVVSMVGCCTLEEKMFLVIEYVPCGDLLTWLRRRRKKVRKWRNLLQRVLMFWKDRPPFFMTIQLPALSCIGTTADPHLRRCQFQTR